MAAAGNVGKDAAGNKIYGAIHSPGIDPSVITVGAANTYGTDARSDDTVTTYSSRGPTRGYTTDTLGVRHYDNLIKPDLVAPCNKIIAARSVSAGSTGNNLLGSYPTLATGSGKTFERVMYLSGTSMAAPVVAGAAAVLLQANPALTPAQVKTILMATADRVSGAPVESQGHGAINASLAVAAALRTPHAPLAGLPVSPAISAWVVSFLYHDHDARAVSLVGSFNQWKPDEHVMHAIRPGVWQVNIQPPPPGSYPYKFLIDQTRWTRDPENPAVVDDGYGAYHSLLHILL